MTPEGTASTATIEVRGLMTKGEYAASLRRMAKKVRERFSAEYILEQEAFELELKPKPRQSRVEDSPGREYWLDAAGYAHTNMLMAIEGATIPNFKPIHVREVL